MTSGIDLRHYRYGDLPEGFRQMLIDVHADAYADAMDDEFNRRFPWFVDHWSGREGFTCVVAFDGEEPTGFAYGAPLQPGREWWRSTDFRPNNGYTSTYAVSEVMVRPRWRKQGVSGRLHDALLKERTETWPCCWWTSRTRRCKRCTRAGATPRSANSVRSPTPRCTR